MLHRVTLLRRALLGAGLLSLLAAAPAVAQLLTPVPPPSQPTPVVLTIFALTGDGRLLVLQQNRVADARVVNRIHGLQIDGALVSIDFRPSNGRLYGLGSAGGIYVVDTRTALATLVSRSSLPLTGSFFDIDFNPVNDRLRVVSDVGQNLRVNVDTGASIADADVSYPGTSAPAFGVDGVAYTNNDATLSTGTTLYVLDTELDQIAIQSPPNEGSLAPVGRLGVDVDPPVGFDIYSAPTDGATTPVQAFASVVRSGRSRLYGINLVTGVAKGFGAFRSSFGVISIAVPPNQF